MRGGGGGGGGGLGLIQLIGSRFGIGGLIVVGLLFLLAPAPIKNMLLGLVGGGSAPTQQQGKMGAPTDQSGDFLAAVLGSTEDVWKQQFAAGKFAHYGYDGREYPPTRLVAFSQGVATGCGNAPSAVGPFYCPADKRVYIDPTFFAEMRNRFQVAGDFAEAYVVAHEVGHHIQTVVGISDQVMQVRQRGNERLSNAEQVKMELQADCLAGVWGRVSGRMEAGDLEEGLNAANAIGDDTLQRKARGTVQPDSFTHGTSEQRKRWLRQGYETGDPAQCDTFNATEL